MASTCLLPTNFILVLSTFPIIFLMETLKSIIHGCVIINQRLQSLTEAQCCRLELKQWSQRLWELIGIPSTLMRSEWKRRNGRKKRSQTLMLAKLSSAAAPWVEFHPSIQTLFDLTSEIFSSPFALWWIVVSLPSPQCMLGWEAPRHWIGRNETPLFF